MKANYITISQFAIVFFLGISLTTHAQSYSSAESVEYDAINDRWLISDGGRIIADDGDGNLTFFAMDGTSHGLEVLGNYVFGCAGTRVKGFDIVTGDLIVDIDIPDSGFLNGMTTDGDHIVYVTDFSKKRITSIDISDIENPILDLVVSNTSQTPNGIYYDDENGRLLYTTWENSAKVKAVDIVTNEQTVIAEPGVGFIDGIARDMDGQYYLSSWGPDAIIKCSNDFMISEELNTPPLDSPADIGYSAQRQRLGIPMGDEVIFVSLMSTATSYIPNKKSIISLTSNPANQTSNIEILLENQGHIDVAIYDYVGNLIHQYPTTTEVQGTHRFALENAHLTSGAYLAVIVVNGKKHTQKFIFE